MPGLVGSLNHSLERSLRFWPWLFPWLAASCPLDWGFFIGFSRRANLSWARCRALVSLSCVPPAEAYGNTAWQTRRWARQERLEQDWTLVEDVWLRYHFVFF